jgi:hypothetical protein
MIYPAIRLHINGTPPVAKTQRTENIRLQKNERLVTFLQPKIYIASLRVC